MAQKVRDRGLEEKFWELMAKRRPENRKVKPRHQILDLTPKKKKFVRCQGTLTSGGQCRMPAVTRHGYVVCNSHGAQSKRNKMPVAVRKELESLGVYKGSKGKLLARELKFIEGIPDDQLLDAKDEVKVAVAIIQRLLRQDFRDPKDEERRVRSLMYSLREAANIKRNYFDIKFSDQNTITRELFQYTFNKYNQIIMEEVKEAETVQRIASRIKELGAEIRGGATGKN